MTAEKTNFDNSFTDEELEFVLEEFEAKKYHASSVAGYSPSCSTKHQFENTENLKAFFVLYLLYNSTIG